MPTIVRWLCLVSLLSPLAAQNRQADLILTRLARVAWDTPYPDHHALPDETCQLVPPHTSLRHGLYDYAYHCMSTADGVIAESFFYPTDEDSPRIVLRRADFRLSDASPELSVQVEHLLRTRLAAEHGEGAVPNGFFEIGASRPNPGLSWTTGDLTLFLHHNLLAVTPSGIRHGVQLIAVRREVLDLRERWRRVDALMTQPLPCNAGLSELCPGPNCFRMVIRAYPQTPSRPEQLYRLALAYETWWSLSQAAPGDPTAEGADVDRASGENARRLALSLYTQVIRMAPGSPEALSAVLRLPRLKLSLDTAERAFFCFSC
jgi:hypothetical protein